MATYIIDDRLYDTAKSQVFYSYKVESGIITFYTTKCGEWFMTTDYNGKIEAIWASKNFAKSMIAQLNDIELYEKLFGKLKKEEALKQALPKQELNLSEMLNHMTAIIEDNAKLREENKQLKLELERTKEHIHARATRNNNPSRNSERDDELELD